VSVLFILDVFLSSFFLGVLQHIITKHHHVRNGTF
jgi:hypothetical protein